MKSLLLCLFVAIVSFSAKAKSIDNGIEASKSDINGTVVNTVSKKALKDVSVTVYTSNKEKVLITDVNGHYSFDDLTPGTYRVVFEKSGYKKVVKEKVVIKGDDGLQLNIEMLEEGDFMFVPGVLNMSAFN
ncbi:MAG: hypothetical protein C4329_00615 [Chitinophagaceae bacterium]